ncbi:MAG: flagellar biosynthesis protein FlhB [Negativicutes bacterium]|nr:flagellar biosynthesis protein FlhB [Negativicutes bacterium]
MECIKIYTTSWLNSDKPNAPRYRLNGLDLQLFAGEKTEEATPKKRDESRQKGQVAKSQELNSAFVILAAFLALKVVGSYMYTELADFMRFMFSHFSTTDMTITDIHVLFFTITSVFLKTTMPVMVFILVISLAVGFLQVGFVFSLEPLMPQFDRINPLSGFQRMFSKRSLVELVKSLIKILIIGFFIYRFMSRQAERIPQLITADLIDTLQLVSSLILDLAFQIGAVILVLAAIDYFYQWWEHNESIKMSKHEIKEEYKQTEGNPQIKGRIRERQRAMAMRRMMQEVPKATAVITNPTHFAIAIKYDKEMNAPLVVAKGQDFLAERIKTLAKENKVAIVENKPLARALYATVEVGEVIPPELYQAIAEVLAYVYRLKRRLS